MNSPIPKKNSFTPSHKFIPRKIIKFRNPLHQSLQIPIKILSKISQIDSNTITKPYPQKQSSNKTTASKNPQKNQQNQTKLQQLLLKNQQKNKIENDILNKDIQVFKESDGDLEQKLDNILREKMKTLIVLNKKNEINKDRQLIIQRSNKLDKLLEALISKIRNLKQQQYSGRWDVLQKKIYLIQKIIAENNIESEIMKKYFNIFVLKRTSYKQLCKSTKTILNNQLYQSVQSNKPIHKDHHKLTKKFHNISTHKSDFKLPNSTDYQKYRYMHPIHLSSQRYIPSTSYKLNYFKYGSLSSIKQKQFKYEDNIKSMDMKINPTISSYKKEYIKKVSKTQDYKQFDCYQNKFKNININYMVTNNKQASKFQMPKIFNSVHILKSNDLKINRSDLQKIPLSTSMIEYRAIDNEERKVFRNKPKNKRLQGMKYLYKTILNQSCTIQ